MTVGCCSAVTLVRRNHLAATHRSPTVRPAEWRRIDDLRSPACSRAAATKASGSSTSRGGAGAARRSSTVCSGSCPASVPSASCVRCGTAIRCVDRARAARRSQSANCGRRRCARRLAASPAVRSPRCASCATVRAGAVMSRSVGHRRLFTDRPGPSRSSTVIASKPCTTRSCRDRARTPSWTRRSTRRKRNCWRRRSGIDLHLLHMVRDPRGVAYSWTSLSTAARSAGPTCRPSAAHLSSTAWWTAWNLAIEWALAPQLAERYRRVRYEDVMDEPRRELADIATWAGGDETALKFFGKDEVDARAGPPRCRESEPVRDRSQSDFAPTWTGRSSCRARTDGSQR